MSTNIDRRTFIKMMGGAGATAAFVSNARPVFAAGLAAPPAAPSEQLAGYPGNQFALLPKEKLAHIYERMVTSRKWETKMKDLFTEGNDGLYGSFHLYIGEEAVANGVVAALEPDDTVCTTHRGHGAVIAKGMDLNLMSAEIFMKQTGSNKGFGGSMHIVDVSKGILGANGIVGSGWFIGPGAAYAHHVRGDGKVSVAFAGDGSTASQYFFNGLRNARYHNLPYIAVIENNGWAVGTPIKAWSHTQNVSSFATGAGVPISVVDGNDVSEVYWAAKIAADRARNGGGPSVIECMTYRWYDHSGFAGAKPGVDGAWGLPYRSDIEVQQWIDRCPIKRLTQFLVDERKIFTADELATIDTAVDEAVEASVEFARSGPLCTPEDGTKHVYEGYQVASRQFLSL